VRVDQPWGHEVPRDIDDLRSLDGARLPATDVQDAAAFHHDKPGIVAVAVSGQDDPAAQDDEGGLIDAVE
jgi:hypothetical protein